MAGVAVTAWASILTVYSTTLFLPYPVYLTNSFLRSCSILLKWKKHKKLLQASSRKVVFYCLSTTMCLGRLIFFYNNFFCVTIVVTYKANKSTCMQPKSWIINLIVGASLSEPHIDRDERPTSRGPIYLSIYLSIYVCGTRVAFVLPMFPRTRLHVHDVISMWH